jgi:hypothetical protein
MDGSQRFTAPDRKSAEEQLSQLPCSVVWKTLPRLSSASSSIGDGLRGGLLGQQRCRRRGQRGREPT